MEPFAEVSCTLKVNVHCDSCQMKMMEVLHSIRGVYALTIDAQNGIANVCGEVDPNRLLVALSRSGQHAELINVKLKHPAALSRHTNYGYHHSNALDETNSYYPTTTRAAMVDQPYYSPYASHESSSYLYRPLLMDHVIREEPMNWCSIL